MVPETVAAPVSRYTAKQVARTIEYLEEGVETSGGDAGELDPRFGYHVPAEGGHGEPGNELLVAHTG